MMLRGEFRDSGNLTIELTFSICNFVVMSDGMGSVTTLKPNFMLLKAITFSSIKE